MRTFRALVFLTVVCVAAPASAAPRRVRATPKCYVTELIRLLLTWMGYRMSIRPIAVPATIQG